MVKIFDDLEKAKRYVCDFNDQRGGGLVALYCEGQELFFGEEQFFASPVITLSWMPPIDLYGLFAHGLQMPGDGGRLVKEFLEWLVEGHYRFEIVSISEWVLELRILDNMDSVVRVASDLNSNLVDIAQEEFGHMPCVEVQPSPFHVSYSVIRIGLS